MTTQTANYSGAINQLNEHFYNKQYEELKASLDTFERENTFPNDDNKAQGVLFHYKAMIAALVDNDYEKAIEHYHEAADHYHKAKDLREYGIVAANIGDLQAKRKEFKKAKMSFEIAVYHLSPFAENQFIVKKDLAATLFMLGEHKESQKLTNELVKSYQAGNLNLKKNYDDQLRALKEANETLTNVQHHKDSVYDKVIMSV